MAIVPVAPIKVAVRVGRRISRRLLKQALPIAQLKRAKKNLRPFLKKASRGRLPMDIQLAVLGGSFGSLGGIWHQILKDEKIRLQKRKNKSYSFTGKVVNKPPHSVFLTAENIASLHRRHQRVKEVTERIASRAIRNLTLRRMGLTLLGTGAGFLLGKRVDRAFKASQERLRAKRKNEKA